MKVATKGREEESKSKKSIYITFFQQALGFLAQDEIRNQVQTHVLDPLIQHIMKQVFPYIILTCVLFVLLLIVVMLTLGIIVFQLRGSVSVSGD